jgi:soluble lytic murein transglycosylase-like protein
MPTSDRYDRRNDATPAPDRRASGPQTPASNVRFNRARELFQRFRQPIIGLGLAGAAFPLVNAQDRDADRPVDSLRQGADPDTLQRQALDAEENVVDQIATSREDQERAKHVGGAVDRYGIPRDMAEDIYDIAREEGIEPRLAYGLVKTESTFDERAKSPVGALGLTQVMPRTARWLQPGTRTEHLYDRQTNLRLGFRYLDQMIDKYRGNVRLALLAYNRGPGTVDKVLKRGGDPDNGYADKVLRS